MLIQKQITNDLFLLGAIVFPSILDHLSRYKEEYSYEKTNERIWTRIGTLFQYRNLSGFFFNVNSFYHFDVL